jgi:RimJ/RimL family protein N-acetyltransferase
VISLTPPLRTPRLELVPLTINVVECVVRGEREEAERLVLARMPARWPNRELVERAFPVSLEAIREKPEARLWGDRVMIAQGEDGERRVIGSVVFHGAPGPDGVAEIAYGVEEASQGQGYATEAVAASVAWALEHDEVAAVQATTFAWHRASLRVIAKVGMVRAGVRDHETLGELLVFERRRER